MTGYHIAQLNVARARAPLDDPLLADFMAQLDDINALADGSTGFVWRLQSDSGNATDIQAFADPRLLIPWSEAASRDRLSSTLFLAGLLHAVILLGGGEPGFLESREIGRKHGVVVTANAFSQIYLATMLGDGFSVIDIEGVHNYFYRDLIRTHQLQGRCRSIRTIGYGLPRPGDTDPDTLTAQCEAAERGEKSVAVERAIDQAEAAIVEDGAEVITLGCSMTFFLQPFIREGLKERGWDVPVLEGYTASIELAKLMVNLNVTASGLTYMDARMPRLLSKIRV